MFALSILIRVIMNVFSCKFRIRLLAIASILVYFYMLGSTVVRDWEGAQVGFREGYESKSGVSTYGFSVVPKGDVMRFPDKIKNLVNGEEIAYRPKAMRLYLSDNSEKTRQVKIEEFFCSVCAFFILGIMFYVPFPFLKLFNTIKVGVFFDEENVRRFRILGFLLLIDFILGCVFVVLQTNIHRTLFELSDYKIATVSQSYIPLLCALLFLILAEVLNNGIEIKKEHDLTV